MKNYLYLLVAIIGSTLLLESCSSAKGSREDYFGYNTSADEQLAISDNQNTSANDLSTAKSDDADWKNPLAENQVADANESNEANEQADSYYAGSTRTVYYSTQPVYVPVIVPWWRHYNSWTYYSRPNRYYHIGWGPYVGAWGCDWYSPWYDYHPYYHHHWYGHSRNNWYYQPYYSYHKEPVKVENTYRRFGPKRGSAIASNSGSRTGERSGVRSGSSRTNDDITTSSVGSISNTRNEGNGSRANVRSGRMSGSDNSDNIGLPNTSERSSRTSSVFKRPTSEAITSAEKNTGGAISGLSTKAVSNTTRNSNSSYVSKANPATSINVDNTQGTRKVRDSRQNTDNNAVPASTSRTSRSSTDTRKSRSSDYNTNSTRSSSDATNSSSSNSSRSSSEPSSSRSGSSDYTPSRSSGNPPSSGSTYSPPSKSSTSSSGGSARSTRSSGKSESSGSSSSSGSKRRGR